MNATTIAAPATRDSSRLVSMTRNGLFISATTAVNSMIGYAFWVLVAHRLTRSDLGYTAGAVALFSLIAQCADRGLSTTIVQQSGSLATSGAARRQLFTTCLALVMRGAVVSAGVVFAIAAVPLRGLLSHLGVVGLLACVACSMAAATGRIFDALSVSLHSAHLMTIRNAAASAGKLVLFAAIGTVNASATSALIAWSVASTLSTALLAARSGLLRGERHAYDSATAHQLLRSSHPHLVANLGGELPQFVLPLLVLSIAGPSMSAVYALTSMVAAAFFVASSAMASSLHAHGSDGRARVDQLTRHVLTLVLPTCVGGIVFAIVMGERLLRLFDASVAQLGHGLLIILAVSSLPDAVTNVWLARWRIQQHARRTAGLNVLMAVSSVLLTVVLLGHLGVNAVGWAWIIAQSCGCLVILTFELIDKGRLNHANSVGE